MVIHDGEPADGHGENIRKFFQPFFDPFFAGGFSLGLAEKERATHGA